MKVSAMLFSYGGVLGETVDSLVGELTQPLVEGDEIHYGRVGDDALISRSRSRAASLFLASDNDVLFMLDHDVSFQKGAIMATCAAALEAKGIVAGLYSKRAFGAGSASRFERDNVEFNPGEAVLHPASAVATGFVAIPRESLEQMKASLLVSEATRGSISDQVQPLVDPDHRLTECIGLSKIEAPFIDFFRPFVNESTVAPGKMEYLSEDWAFSVRAKLAGVPLFIYERPILVHRGNYGFTIQDSVRRR